MTKDEIIRMAREACDPDQVDAWQNGFWTLTQEELERFAALVAAAEREACAKVCDDKHHAWRWDDKPDSASGPRDCAAAIRARGNKCMN